MRKTLLTSVLMIAAMLSFATAQADQINGKVEFAAVGAFLPNPDNPTGVDFYQSVAECLAAGCTNFAPYPPYLSNLTGNILQMVMDGIGATGSGITFTLNDIDLTGSLPANEWTIAKVATPSGATGQLVFDIISGGAVDNGTSGFADLGGQGVFRFICDNVDAPSCGYYTDTVGSWSVSNTGGGNLLVGINVPAPATIGILGCALLLLGVIRRRKMMVAI